MIENMVQLGWFQRRLLPACYVWGQLDYLPWPEIAAHSPFPHQYGCLSWDVQSFSTDKNAL